MAINLIFNKNIIVPPPAEGFSIVAMSDSHMSLVAEMNQWIVKNKERLNIQHVLHLGDVIGIGSIPSNMTYADTSFGILDYSNIPYQICMGNHEYDSYLVVDRADTGWLTKFPQTRYTSKNWWNGGFYDATHTANHYNIININGMDWLFMCLEFGPRDEVLTWANEILTANSTKKCILSTHCYLYSDNTRVTGEDHANPKSKTYYPDITGTINDGEDIWNNLVKLHDNIILVQSGHIVYPPNDVYLSAYRSDVSNGGQVVHQTFANWQDAPTDYRGWLRVITIYPLSNSMKIRTYSITQWEKRVDGMNFLNLTY